jgi:hypothetical protein
VAEGRTWANGLPKKFPPPNQIEKKYYETKQVRPVFVETTEEIIVVTVYVYYF